MTRTFSRLLVACVLACLSNWLFWIVLDLGVDYRAVDPRNRFIVGEKPSEKGPVNRYAHTQFKFSMTVVVVVNTLDGVFFITPYLIFRQLRRAKKDVEWVPTVAVIGQTLLSYFWSFVQFADKWIDIGDWPLIAVPIQLAMIVVVGILIRKRARMSVFEVFSVCVTLYYVLSRVLLLMLSQ